MKGLLVAKSTPPVTIIEPDPNRPSKDPSWPGAELVWTKTSGALDKDTMDPIR